MVLEWIPNFDTSATVTVDLLYSARQRDDRWLPRSWSKLLRWLHKKNRPYSKNKLLKRKIGKREIFPGMLHLLEQKPNTVHHHFNCISWVVSRKQRDVICEPPEKFKAQDTQMPPCINGYKMLLWINGHKIPPAYLHFWPVFQEKCPCV